MLIRFNVGNFLSFNEIQEFSMIAGKVRNKLNRVYVDDSIKLLKFAAIFGANASGKSNLVSAINFAQNMIVRGFPKDCIWRYCKLYEENKEKQSYFEFEIKINNQYFSYGFEVVLNTQSIKSEWLYEVSPSGHDREIFSRDVVNGTYSISNYFSSKIRSRLAVYADDIKTDDSILFLKILNQNKATLYAENSDLNILRDIFRWFQMRLDINFPDRPVSNYSYFVSNRNFDAICATIRAFGTGITQYSIVETSPEAISKDIPHKLIDEIITRLNAKRGKKDETDDTQPTLVLRGNKSFYIFENDDDKNITCKTINFSHGNDKIFFELFEESDGTIRLLDLLTVLFDNGRGNVFIIDEVDRCLHPQLTYKFVSEYLKIAASREIQLIVTSHESRLLDFDLLRKDEIWFVNKSISGESTIYSLDEYNERFDKKIDRAYLEGRYGGVPVFSTVFPIEE